MALASAGEDRHDQVVTFAGAAEREGFADGAVRVRADPGLDLAPREMALTAGKPVLYHRVRIVDAAGKDVAAGEPGEIWIRGRSVMQGYWENAQATREAFRDGWFRNGDVGLFDHEGYLYIVDRIKGIIIVGSSNVYPGDLETVLGDCADICEAGVLVQDDRVYLELHQPFWVDEA